jgi:hypothetical protein
MSAADRFDRPATKPISQLDRPQVAGRVDVLRQALDRLEDQSGLDGGEGYRCRGAMKVELIRWEAELRRRDRQAPATTLVDALSHSSTVATLERAGAELARVRRAAP